MSNLWITPSELGGTYATSAFADDAVQIASNLLWSMSGRRYNGVTTVTERYITSIDAFRYQGASANQFQPMLVNGDVVNVPREDWNDSAYQSDGTSSLSRIRLRGRPIIDVHLVRSLYDGKIISQDRYYVAEHSTLIAYVGSPWPPGNIEVTYTYGVQPPKAGSLAARTLAIEFIKYYEGDDCALPDRVTSISRQGVSYTILDNQDFLENMRTGIYVVDLFLKNANPAKALAPSRVFSPDVPRARRAAPSLPLVLTPSAAYDAALSHINNFTAAKTFTLTGSLSGLTAYNNGNYTLQLTANSYAETVTKTYSTASAAFRTTSGIQYLDLSFDYGTTYQALGPSHPGTWTLYAVQTSTGATVELLTGNLQVLKVTSSQVNPSSTSVDVPTKFICKQGSTFTRTVTWSQDGIPVDLGSYTAAMQVRSSYTSATATLSLVSTAGAAKTVNSAVVASNVATIETSAAHGYTSGSTVTLFNLTASSGSVQYLVKSAPTSTTFTVAYTSANGSLTLGASPTATLAAGIVLGGAAGTIQVTVAANVTTAITAGNYVYDLELTSSVGVVTRLLEGQFIVTPQVTV